MSRTRGLLALLLLLALGGCGTAAPSKHARSPHLPVWTVASFGVSLQHPAGWHVAAGYLERLQGKTGYVSLSALQGSGLTPRAAAESQAHQALNSFGSAPTLKALKVDGQQAFVIQPSSGGTEAAAVVLYPKPQEISGVPYRYLIVTSTAKDIMPIVQTLRFLGKKH